MAWEPTRWKDGRVGFSQRRCRRRSTWSEDSSPPELCGRLDEARCSSACSWCPAEKLWLPTSSPLFYLFPHPSCAEVTEIHPPPVICGCPWPIQASFCLTRWVIISFLLLSFSLPLLLLLFSSEGGRGLIEWDLFWLCCCMCRASSRAQTSGEGGRRSSLGDADDVIRQADLTGDLSLRSGGVSACIGSVSLPAGIRHRWAGLLQGGGGSLNVRDKHLSWSNRWKQNLSAGTVAVGSVRASTLSCIGSRGEWSHLSSTISDSGCVSHAVWLMSDCHLVPSVHSQWILGQSWTFVRRKDQQCKQRCWRARNKQTNKQTKKP